MEQTFDISRSIQTLISSCENNEEMMTVAHIGKIVADSLGVHEVLGRKLVSNWIANPDSGYYVRKGVGIRKGKPMHKHREGECLLCGQKPREHRMKALTELLQKEENSELLNVLLSKNEDFQKELEALTKKYSLLDIDII